MKALTVMLVLSWLIGPAGASGYFRDVLSCDSFHYERTVPPDDVLAQAISEPPTPLFTGSFESRARWAIVPKWLPDTFDDIKYLEHGEGAYRAQTAHLCNVYEKNGARVALKGFVGRLVLVIRPVPVSPTPQASEALVEAAKHTDPCKSVYPYKEGAPAGVVSMFTAIRNEVLTPAACPVSADYWNRRTRLIEMGDAGLGVSYLSRDPISDPAFDPSYEVRASVGIWTDGNALCVSVLGGDIRDSALYKSLQRATEIPREGLQIPYVSEMVFAGEWVDAGGRLVPTRQQATRQKIYLDLGDGLDWMAVAPYPPEPHHLAEAAWLCLAKRATRTILGSVYHSGRIRHIVEKELLGQQLLSRGEALQHVENRRDLCLGAVSSVEEAPCPERLSGARDTLLSALRVSRAVWEVAYPEWHSALSKPEGTSVDFQALVDAVEDNIAALGLAEFSSSQARDAIADAQRQSGVIIDEVGRCP